MALIPRFRSPLRDFTAPARPRIEIWRTLLGLVLFFVFYSVAVGGGLALLLSDDPGAAADPTAQAGPRLTLLLLGIFLPAVPVLWLVLRLVHRRGLGSLLGPAPLAGDFLRGLALALGYWAAGAVLMLLVAPAPDPGPVRSDPALLVPALGLLLVQIGVEELVFRGYLLQQLGARFRSPLAWALLPSVLFGGLHYANGATPAEGLAATAFATIVGLILAGATARRGGLGAALGLHYGINFGGLILIGAPGMLGGLALWQWDLGQEQMMLAAAIDIALLLPLALACRRLLPVRRG